MSKFCKSAVHSSILIPKFAALAGPRFSHRRVVTQPPPRKRIPWFNR